MPAPAAPTALRAAVTMNLPLAAATMTSDPAGISLDITATLDIGGFALSSGGTVPPPALALDIDVYRANGWLAGGPQGSAPAPGVLRTPALRRARMNVRPA